MSIKVLIKNVPHFFPLSHNLRLESSLFVPLLISNYHTFEPYRLVSEGMVCDVLDSGGYSWEKPNIGKSSEMQTRRLNPRVWWPCPY